MPPSEPVAAAVVRGGAARTAAYGAATALTALASALLLRHLGVADVGRYGTVTAIVALTTGVAEAGLTVTATRELALAEPAGRARLLGPLVGLRVALALAGAAAAVAFAAVTGLDAVLVLGAALSGLGVVLVSAQAALLVPLVVELRNGRVAVNDVARQGLMLAGVVALVLAGAPLLPFLALQLVVGLGLLLLTPAVLGPGRLVAPRYDRAVWGELLRRTLPVAVVAVVAVVYLRVVVVLSALLLDDRATGLVVTSTRVVELVSALPLLLAGVVLPVVSTAARDDRDRLRRGLQRLTEVMALAGAAVALGLAVGAEPVLVVLGGEAFADAAPVLRVHALAVLTTFVMAAWTPTLVGLGEMRALVVATSAGLGVLVVLGLLLIPALGPEGAAVAVAAADMVNAAVLLARLRAAGPGRDLRFGFAARLTLALVPAAAVALALPGPAAVVAAASVAVLLAAAAALGLVPPELRAAARRRR